MIVLRELEKPKTRGQRIESMNSVSRPFSVSTTKIDGSLLWTGPFFASCRSNGKTVVRGITLLSVALFSLACSSEVSPPDSPTWMAGNGATSSTGGSLSAPGGADSLPVLGGATAQGDPDSYPPGPYGSGNPKVGDVVEDLAWQGFARLGDGRLASEGPLQNLQLSSLRTAGKSYALIHTATVWCPSCRAAADDLAARGEELEAKGAVLIELLLEGQSSQIPTDAELEAWVQGSDLTVTTVRAADERTAVVFPAREYVYLIDLASMKVVWAERALFSDPSIAALGIEELLTYL